MKIDAISFASQQFEQAQVHLTKNSAMIFIEGIITCSETIFKATVINLYVDGGSGGSGQPGIERRVSLLEDEVRARRSNNYLLFADIYQVSINVGKKLFYFRW